MTWPGRTMENAQHVPGLHTRRCRGTADGADGDLVAFLYHPFNQRALAIDDGLQSAERLSGSVILDAATEDAKWLD